ncbi:Holliday junction branch migration protein RuvA [Lentisalinibacter salinarum]|uniref:Holliday junction branch migration protein RuvA n=1 Tax=Lentisalinibacter salinarum TaxID=2992239 RepID=UPI003869C252
MIGSLRGRLESKQPPWIVLDVGGVGYEVETPMSTFFQLPETGAEVRLLTHLLVRDDAQQLYGFATEEERVLFRNLLKVSGVGARMALAILSGISVEGFRRCVEYEDTASLVKVPGIGKKTAERLIIEMRDRVAAVGPAGVAGAPPGTAPPEDARGEASTALMALGYRAAEVTKLLRQVDTENLSAEEIIRQALRQAAR